MRCTPWAHLARWGFIVLLAGLGLGAPAHAQAALGEPAWVDGQAGYEYRWTPVVSASPAALAAGAVRLLLDWQDADNTYYLDLRGDQATFGLRQGGVERQIGVGGPIRRGLGGDTLNLSIQRAEGSWALYVNHVRAAAAEGRAWDGGQCGWQIAGEGVGVQAGVLQNLEELFFADDFMRTDEQLGGWTTALGAWENNQQGSKVSRSANAFSFRSVGGETCLVTHGNAYDRDYRAQVAVASESSGAVGLVVGYQDPNNYYLLRLTSASHPDGGTARLVRVFEGQRVDLTPAVPGGYQPDTWYQLELLLAGGWLRAWIDQRPLFEVAAQCFGEGLVGLYSEAAVGETASDAHAGALFDDVIQRSWPLFEDAFVDHAHNARWGAPGGWEQTTRGDGLTALALPATGEATFGAESWYDPTVSADFWAQSGAVGLALGEARYRVWLDAGEVRLEGSDGGVVARAPFARGGEGPWRLEVTADAGLLRVSVDGREALTSWVGAPVEGRAALLSAGAAGAAVSDVRAGFRPAWFSLPPALPAEFVEDRYMTTWAAPGAAWVRVPDSPLRWHKGFFFGDREVNLTVPEIGQQAGTVTIYLGAGESDTPTGYAVEVSLQRDSQQLGLRVLRDGTEVAAGQAETGDQAALGIALRGGFVVVTVDGTAALSYALPQTNPEARP